MKFRLPQAVLLALALAGCATAPSFESRADLLDFLVDGQTTREEAVLKLGHPSGKFERENILTYRLGFEPKSKGYYIVERKVQADGWPVWWDVRYSLVLVFDDGGVLRRHALVEVH